MSSSATVPNSQSQSQWELQLDNPSQRVALVLGDNDFTTVTDTVTALALRRTPPAWYVAFAVSLSLLSILIVTVGYLLTTGVGVWGNNNTVSWGFPIINFVFWVGIGHAGTLISAILFLLRQNWRTGINRFAEAMTIFAVCCAGLFPGIRVGRLWLASWLVPSPNALGMWPQARSPLLWDVFAVGTYATVSLLFWYMGMIPDLATLRDRAKGRFAQMAYGVFSLGWNGSSRHWLRFEKAYLLLAALATPLVLSVHSVVSFDFATSQVPGWHTTIFPPYFVAGAVFGGFAMVLVLSIPAREWFGLKDLITHRHIENMAKVMLGTGMIVARSGNCAAVRPLATRWRWRVIGSPTRMGALSGCQLSVRLTACAGSQCAAVAAAGRGRTVNSTGSARRRIGRVDRRIVGTGKCPNASARKRSPAKSSAPLSATRASRTTPSTVSAPLRCGKRRYLRSMTR